MGFGDTHLTYRNTRTCRVGLPVLPATPPHEAAAPPTHVNATAASPSLLIVADTDVIAAARVHSLGRDRHLCPCRLSIWRRRVAGRTPVAALLAGGWLPRRKSLGVNTARDGAAGHWMCPPSLPHHNAGKAPTELSRPDCSSLNWKLQSASWNILHRASRVRVRIVRSVQSGGISTLRTGDGGSCHSAITVCEFLRPLSSQPPRALIIPMWNC